MSLIKLVALSDTHGILPRIPDGDILVHAGDLTGMGSHYELESAVASIAELPHPHKVVISGNHDITAERGAPDWMRLLCESKGITYLCDTGAEVMGLKFWGSPFTPRFCDWAFRHERDSDEARRRWGAVPRDLDVLITHGPPFGIGDRSGGRCVGDLDLTNALWGMTHPPRFHFFGHIHEDPGTWRLDGVRTKFSNVSTPYGKRKPTILQIDPRW